MLTPPSVPKIQHQPIERRRVLVVDDSQTVVHVLRAYLMNLNLDFDSASDARTAMRMILKNPPSLIISDIQMPGMDGIEFCRALRSTHGLSRTRFLLMSSRWTDERRRDAQRLGVDGCLQKPISAEQLAQLVTRLLGPSN